ncbi:MAG TPA: FtsQ-type POTRA domain-containing protein [Acidimicrobiales bacterium]|nr:FtsQ-type POTRA domain-containing protein [Acidimicrobiales bacterium]
MGPTDLALGRAGRAPTPGRRAREPHPRVSARRRAVSKELGRRRLVVLCALAVLATLAAIAWPLAHSHYFSARVIVVRGALETPVSEVLAAAGLGTHPAMIDVHPGAAAHSIEALPWVLRATVALDWPDGVRITLSERTAVCAVAHGGGWAEVDRTGRVLADVATPPPGLVRATLVGATPAPGRWVAAGSGPALAAAAALPPVLAPQVAMIEAAPGGTVDLGLVDGVRVVLGPATQLGAKFEDVAAIEAGARPRAGSVMDVSVPQSPTVSAG